MDAEEFLKPLVKYRKDDNIKGVLVKINFSRGSGGSITGDFCWSLRE